MLSPLFWISFVVVAFGIKWVAEGLLSLASLDLQKARPVKRVRPARRHVPNYENKKAA